MTAGQELVIVLEQDPSGYPPWDEEPLLGEPLGQDHFRVTVTPTFAPDISRGDVVHAVRFEGRWYFDSLVEAGGHSTVRVVLFADEHHDRLLALGPKVGCDIAHTAINGLFAIDIPPEASMTALQAELRRGAEAGFWDFNEGVVADNHRQNLKLDDD